jgi:hypothetical protein
MIVHQMKMASAWRKSPRHEESAGSPIPTPSVILPAGLPRNIPPHLILSVTGRRTPLAALLRKFVAFAVVPPKRNSQKSEESAGHDSGEYHIIPALRRMVATVHQIRTAAPQ